MIFISCWDDSQFQKIAGQSEERRPHKAAFLFREHSFGTEEFRSREIPLSDQTVPLTIDREDSMVSWLLFNERGVKDV